MDEGKRKALESLPRPSPIGLSQSMWTTICPFDPEVKLGGDADDGRHLTIVGTSAAAADTMVWIGPFTGMSKPGQGKRKEKYGQIPKDSHGMMVDVVSPCSCRFVGGRLVQMTFRFHFRSCLIDRSSLLRQFRRTQKHDCQNEKRTHRATAPMQRMRPLHQLQAMAATSTSKEAVRRHDRTRIRYFHTLLVSSYSCKRLYDFSMACVNEASIPLPPSRIRSKMSRRNCFLNATCVYIRLPIIAASMVDEAVTAKAIRSLPTAAAPFIS